MDSEKALGEKGLGQVEEVGSDFASSNDALPIPVPEKLSRWNRTIQSLKGFEARGISRVQPSEREAPTLAALVQMAIMWYSANITLNNLAVGFLGPLLLQLGFLDRSAGPHFNTSLQSVGNTVTIAANRLSFFSLQLSATLSWAGSSSDFFVYYPECTSKRMVFAMTFIGLSVSFIFVNLLGVGLASGVSTNPGWDTAYSTSSGALLLAGFDGLGGFGKFCAVIVTLGLCSNTVPCLYCSALNFQTLGKVWKAIPRYIWVTAAAIVYLVCAVAGRDHLFFIFQNFLALMGYWLAIFVMIVFEEHMIFRQNKGFDWAAYEDKTKLPIGIAALISFLVGWIGSILGMYQLWWTGPIARHIGDLGGDVGIWLGIAFTAVVFPPLRFVELRQIGR
ncbi:MAG: hypothetical protein Q9177_002608 [Variospora cf. flavescens]